MLYPLILVWGRLMSGRRASSGRSPTRSRTTHKLLRYNHGGAYWGVLIFHYQTDRSLNFLRPAHRLCATLQQVTALFASASASEAIQLWLCISLHCSKSVILAAHSLKRQRYFWCTVLYCICIRCSVQLRLENRLSWGRLWYYLVPPRKWQYKTSNQANTASFRILSNPLIRHCTVRVLKTTHSCREWIRAQVKKVSGLLGKDRPAKKYLH